MTEFYFIRHGQTEANALGLKQGTINSQITLLNDKGKKQAQHLHDVFDIGFADQLIASPLHRTQETAAILNATAKLPTETDERLLEISYGQWDGLKNQALQAQYPAVFDPVLRDVLPSYTEYATRSEEHTSEADGKFIVVTHGFTVKAAVLAALQPRDAMTLPEPDNTSVTKISLIDGHYYVWFYNRLL